MVLLTHGIQQDFLSFSDMHFKPQREKKEAEGMMYLTQKTAEQFLTAVLRQKAPLLCSVQARDTRGSLWSSFSLLSLLQPSTIMVHPCSQGKKNNAGNLKLPPRTTLRTAQVTMMVFSVFKTSKRRGTLSLINGAEQSFGKFLKNNWPEAFLWIWIHPVIQSGCYTEKDQMKKKVKNKVVRFWKKWYVIFFTLNKFEGVLHK